MFCFWIVLGADISTVVNQAALKAANEGADCVNMGHLEYAIDKLLMGKFFWVEHHSQIQKIFPGVSER